MNLSHAELVERGARWLRRRLHFGVVVTEITTWCGEVPDVIGFNSNTSVVIEAKTSRADFQQDALKPHRIAPDYGMGDRRFYLCPPDIIKPEDLPPGWGLLYCRALAIKVVRWSGPTDKIIVSWYDSMSHAHPFKANKDHEMGVLYSLLRRAQLRGLDLQTLRKPLKEETA